MYIFDILDLIFFYFNTFLTRIRFHFCILLDSVFILHKLIAKDFGAGNAGFNYRFNIQETLFNVDFQMNKIISLAMGYFVDKHDMKKLYMYTPFNKISQIKKTISQT